MKTLYDIFDSGVSILGISVAIKDIESILSVILLVISLLNLLFKFGKSLYNKLKDGKLTSEELDEISKELDELEQNTDKLLNPKEGE